MTDKTENNEYPAKPLDPSVLIQGNFEEWFLKLTGYARYLMLRKKWQNQIGGLPAGSEEAEDVVLSVFEKVSSDIRHWNPTKFPDLLPVLFKMVKSEVSDLNQLNDNKENKGSFFGETGGAHPDVEASFARLSSNPLIAAQKTEKNIISREIITKLRESIKGDSDLNDYLDLYLDGTKPREIVELMEKTDDQIIALKKRIERKIKKIIDADYSKLIFDETGGKL